MGLLMAFPMKAKHLVVNYATLSHHGKLVLNVILLKQSTYNKILDKKVCYLLTVSVGVLVQVACGCSVARPRPAHALQPGEVLLLTCVDM